MGKSIDTKPTRSLKKIKKALPFRENDRDSMGGVPRNMSSKQRSTVLHGLKHLGVPVEPCL